MKPEEAPKRCEACRRPQWRGPRMEERPVAGLVLLLCVEPTECRRNWPKD